MNTTEFLENLASRDWIGSVGTPIPAEVYPNNHPLVLSGEKTAGEQFTKEDGTMWYYVQVRDESADACVYRNIHFYVIDEGLETERVLEKDKLSESIINKAAPEFTTKVKTAAENSGNMFIEKMDDESKAAVVTKFEPVDGGVEERRFLVNEDANGELTQTRII